MENTLALEMLEISKAFGATKALKSVSMTVKTGSIHGLIGQNGAGKSTLVKILAGVHRPDSGIMRIYGKPVSFDSPAQARQYGIGMVFQEFSLIPTLTVAQNIFLGSKANRPLGVINDRELEMGATKILEQLEVNIDPHAVVGELGVADQQLTEIAKALSQERRILVFDEPTAALSQGETEALFEILRRLAQKEGLAIIFISHHLREILDICDEVTVLRDGEVTFSGEVAGQTLESLVSAMLPVRTRIQSALQREAQGNQQAPLIEVHDLHVTDVVKGASFSLYPGEVLGIAGLLGSGRTELLKAIYGILRPTQGTVSLFGQIRSFRSPAEAITDGIVLVPEDRRRQGLVLDHGIEANISLTVLERLSKFGVLNLKAADELAHTFVQRLSIASQNIHAPVSHLSGGNQQKVVLSKMLATQPRVLLLDDPTFGIDIGTSRQIIEIVRDFAAAGNAAIWVSSDFDELIRATDRILVMKDGRIEQEFLTGVSTKLSEEDLLHAVQ